MANKTIPQLPEQTGKTDNDLLAIVDSGETTTSKIKLSTLLSGLGSPFIAADGTNNVVPDYYATSDINSATSQNGIVAGSSNQINAGDNQAIVGGVNNQLSGIASVMFGGNNNTIGSSNSAYNGMVGGVSNFMTNEDFSFIGGGDNHDLTNGGRSAILGGANSLINESVYCGILAGRYNEVRFCQMSSVVGSYAGIIYGDSRLTPLGIYGSQQCYIRRTAGSGTASFEGTNSGIYTSLNSDIAGQSANETNRGVIIGSNDTKLTGGTTNTLMLGCSGRTGTNSYTTYVETLEAFEGIVLNDYANLNFASDAAAATGGVPLGGVYHNSGDMKIRIT
jgi:hypothetical protein